MIPGAHPKPTICLTYWSPIAQRARVLKTAATLSQQGFEVVVIAVCFERVGQTIEHNPGGFSVHSVYRPSPRRLPVRGGRVRPGVASSLWNGLRGMAAHCRFFRAAWAVPADVYHAVDLFVLPSTWLAAKLRRRPIIYDATEISTDRAGLRPVAKIVGWVEGFLARRVSRMTTTTGMRAAHFRDHYAIPEPAAIQSRPNYREPVTSGQIRAQLPPGRQNDVVVLYQGGLQQGRGLFNLLEVAARVEHANFVFLGGGRLEESLKQSVHARGLTERVFFLPAVPAAELHAWTCSADIGIQILENTCLNHYTTDSNKLFEYTMAGLPVVASDFPEIRKVVSEHDLGILVNPGDVNAITDAVRHLVDNRELRARFAFNATRAAPQLSWETQVPVLLTVYRELNLLPDVPDETTA